MKNFDLTPDPINIPGDLTASATGTTSVALVSPLSVSTVLAVTLKSFFFHIYYKHTHVVTMWIQWIQSDTLPPASILSLCTGHYSLWSYFILYSRI